MESVVVDTDVISFLFKRDSRAELYRPSLEGRLLIVSFQTVAELLRGAEQNRWGEPLRRRMGALLASVVVRMPNHETCRAWASIMSRGKTKGRPVSGGDAWVAAVAIQDGLTLVTHNRRHFEFIEGLKLGPPVDPA